MTPAPTVIEQYDAWWNRTNSKYRKTKAAFIAGYNQAMIDVREAALRIAAMPSRKEVTDETQHSSR